jgi:hypothetical protein
MPLENTITFYSKQISDSKKRYDQLREKKKRAFVGNKEN